jgi:hypothetical protein
MCMYTTLLYRDICVTRAREAAGSLLEALLKKLCYSVLQNDSTTVRNLATCMFKLVCSYQGSADAQQIYSQQLTVNMVQTNQGGATRTLPCQV